MVARRAPRTMACAGPADGGAPRNAARRLAPVPAVWRMVARRVPRAERDGWRMVAHRAPSTMAGAGPVDGGAPRNAARRLAMRPFC